MRREPRNPVLGDDGSVLVRYEFDYKPRAAGKSGRGGPSAALALPPEVAILWIATATGSGIVGNAAYDLLKYQVKVMRRFVASHHMLKKAAELAVLSLLSFQGRASDIRFMGRAKVYRSKRKTRCVLLPFDLPLDHELWKAERIHAIVEFRKPSRGIDSAEVYVWLETRGLIPKERPKTH
jgi:hypothetical protein